MRKLIILLIAVSVYAGIIVTPTHAQPTCPDYAPHGIGRPAGTILPDTLSCLTGSEHGTVDIVSDARYPCGSAVRFESSAINNVMGEHDPIAFSSSSPFGSGQARVSFDMAIFHSLGNYTDPVVAELISYDAGDVEVQRVNRNITAQPYTVSLYGDRFYHVEYVIDAVAGGSFVWVITNPSPIYIDNYFMSSLVIVDSLNPLVTGCIVPNVTPTPTPLPTDTPDATPTPNETPPITTTATMTVTITPTPAGTLDPTLTPSPLPATPSELGTPVPAIPTGDAPTPIPIPSIPDVGLPSPPIVELPTMASVAIPTPDTVTGTTGAGDAGTIHNVVTRVYDVIGEPVTEQIPVELWDIEGVPVLPAMRGICLIMVNLCPPITTLIVLIGVIVSVVFLVFGLRSVKIFVMWLRTLRGVVAG